MTLLFSAQGPGIGVLAISDVITSRPSAQSEDAVALPLGLKDVAHSSSGFSVAGVSQKMIVANRTMVQWAGSLIIARLAITAIIKHSNDGNILVDPQEVIKSLDLSNEELAELSLSYHYCDEEIIQRYHYNCEPYNWNGYSIIAAGSGVWDFVEDMDIIGGTQNDNEAAFFSLLSRALYTAINETLNSSNYDFLYGGWFEILTDEAKCFCKLPMAIKFWSKSKDGDIDIHLPVFFSWYDNHDLMVCRIENSIDQYTKKVLTSISVHEISDFLRRNTLRHTVPVVVWNPRVICHVLITEGCEEIDVLIRKDHFDDMEFHFEREQAVFTFPRTLMDTVQNMANTQKHKFKAVKTSSAT